MSRVDDIVVIVQDARKLVYPWTDLHMVNGRVEKVPHMSLLTALRNKAKEVVLEEGGNAAGKPVVSKMPTAQEAALSMAIEIEKELGRVALFLGASATADEPTDNYDYICHQVDLWGDDVVRMVAKHLGDLLARAETELEIRPKPKVLRARCPECQAFGQVHIGIDKHGRATDAVCKSCETRWGRYELGRLASAINEREEA